MAEPQKRKADGPSNEDAKRAKTKKQWRVPNKDGKGPDASKAINPGDKGIWATCNKGREKKCMFELLDLFNEYAKQMYPTTDTSKDGDSASIEDEISKELNEMKKPAKGTRMFEAVIPDMPCVIFIRCRDPINPQDLVHKIAADAAADPSTKRTRFTQRLSPVSIIERASEEGLIRACDVTLHGPFHASGTGPKKFAIRPTFRNHNVLNRNMVIETIAASVVKDDNPNAHSVDLKGYDLLILVEIYKNVCGIAVVGNDFEALKRYNLTEIFEPTPKDPNVGTEVVEQAQEGNPRQEEQ